MLKVFQRGDTDFSTNGDVVLKPLKARVKKEDNGNFYLAVETDLSYINYLVDGNIIVADTPQGDQAFRIRNPRKTKNKITLTAPHVFYDSQNYIIADSYVVDKNCNQALDHLNSATDTASPFTVSSDIGTIDSYRCVRKTLLEAFETVLERWGGHFVRDNWNFQIKKEIGADNQVTIRYAKNLKDISCQENWDTVCTKILPVGKEGTLLNAVDDTASIFIESGRQYEIPYTRTVSFAQDDILAENYATEADYKAALVDDLQAQALAYLDENELPKVNYTLSANVERITDIGDTIEVIDERLGVDIMTQVISYEYDCILKKYVQIEFGNFLPKLSGLLSDINENAKKIASESADTVRVLLSDELQAATNSIWAMMDSSNVLYNGNSIMVVDSLPAETATYVMLINSGGIGFSSTGINGTFNSAWQINGTLDMQNINVINLVADLIKGGTLKLGSMDNESGLLELYDEANNLIGQMDKNGLKMYGSDGSYVLINSTVGFAGYDRNDVKTYWADRDEFHMKKSVVEEEITLCNSIRFIPITIMSGSTVVNKGVGLVSVVGGAS